MYRHLGDLLSVQAHSMKQDVPPDTDSDSSETIKPEIFKAQRKKASKAQNSLALKLGKRGLAHKDLAKKFSRHSRKSVALGIAQDGLVHKALPSLFGGIPKNPDVISLHPSEDEDLKMSCELTATPNVPVSNSFFASNYLMGTFASWNCRGIRSKIVDLKSILNKFHPSCIALQETFLNSNIPLKLRGYNSVQDAGTGINNSGGVCILTSNLYPSSTLPLHTPLQAVAVQIRIKSLISLLCIPTTT
ncbi:hypothetical protein AVEN_198112-1 [Araneus ventricosus]|uniref:Endonuclease/exonuclease/phosphatase domain-containing protein n=1 Tax=Araneus ventricosus TaxID=182803 RepID=A0A4Y2M292_ARAVE|nr:hypothetical protein AVEN_198112-1 [Araneus ventricosus]